MCTMVLLTLSGNNVYAGSSLESSDISTGTSTNSSSEDSKIANSGSGNGSYLIGLKEQTDPDKLLIKKSWQRKNIKKLSAKLLVLDLTPQELQSAAWDRNIEFIEPNAIVKVASVESTDDDGSRFYIDEDISVLKSNKLKDTIPWGIKAIGADQSLQKSIEGKKIKIAVLDTGIANHSDLQIAGGKSFVSDNLSYTDDHGHGTHVAGTIAALSNKKGVVGVASNANVYALKVLDRQGEGTYSQVIEAIQWSIANKMNIISMSFGGTSASQALQAVIQEATAKGILVIAAAGNQGAGAETELYPALYPEVISVGAVSPNHKRAGFSSTGQQLDLVAPGTNILSTTFDGTYGVMSGTSMAVPHVTGSAAILWSKNKKWTQKDVKNTLYRTATPLGDKSEYGNGIVNVAKALGLTNKPIPPSQEVPEDTPTPNSSSTPTPTPTPNSSSTPIPTSVPTPPPGEFDIKKLDEKFYGLGNAILNLKQMATEEGNISLAKQLEASYYDLVMWNRELHQLPEEAKQISKEDVSQLNALSKRVYESRKEEFVELETLYLGVITQARTQLKGLQQAPNIASTSEIIQLLSYNKYGDGQSVAAGSSANVGITLSSPKSRINITVYPQSNSSQIVASSTLWNASAKQPA